MPLTSVIVPTYNRRRYLGEAIASALAQTSADVEVIVVDDGSTDGTREYVTREYGSDRRVRYIWQQNAERSVARNTGIRAATGEYVAFVDSDDLWTPRKLEKQLGCIAGRPAVSLVHSGFQLLDEQSGGVSEEVLCRDEAAGAGVFVRLIHGNIVGCLTAVVRRSAFGRVGMFDTDRRLLPVCEDWEMWLRLAYGSEVEYVPEPLAIHRLHPEASSRRIDIRVYGLLVRKIARYVRDEDRRMVKRIAEGVCRSWIEEAEHKGDRREVMALQVHGALLFGSQFALRSLRTWAWRKRRGIQTVRPKTEQDRHRTAPGNPNRSGDNSTGLWV